MNCCSHAAARRAAAKRAVPRCRLSVRLSVCHIDRQQRLQPTGLLLSASRAGDIDRWQLAPCSRRRAAGAGAQHQMRVASC